MVFQHSPEVVYRGYSISRDIRKKSIPIPFNFSVQIKFVRGAWRPRAASAWRAVLIARGVSGGRSSGGVLVRCDSIQGVLARAGPGRRRGGLPIPRGGSRISDSCAALDGVRLRSVLTRLTLTTSVAYVAICVVHQTSNSRFFFIGYRYTFWSPTKLRPPAVVSLLSCCGTAVVPLSSRCGLAVVSL